jgi:hypothetical protein
MKICYLNFEPRHFGNSSDEEYEVKETLNTTYIKRLEHFAKEERRYTFPPLDLFSLFYADLTIHFTYHNKYILILAIHFGEMKRNTF